MTFLHGSSLLHRDLKPENLLVFSHSFIHLFILKKLQTDEFSGIDSRG